MGPLPIPPSSPSLTPLNPLLSGNAEPSRSSSADSRPVGLPSDQVLSVSDELGSRVQENPVRPDAEKNKESKREESQAPEVEVENPRLSRRPTSVTYRVHPDLQRALQGNVIDSETSEVLREIPSEDRIQLTKAFRENLGSSLDVSG